VDIFEAMETCRAIRNLKPDPVDPELITRLVHYATRAPNAGNSQLWGFLVVTDEAGRRWFGDLLRKAWEGRMPAAPEPSDRSAQARGARVFRRFVLEFDRIPAVIFPCIENAYPPQQPNPLFVHSSIYLATQNLLLAARALGLGAAMTTFHIVDEPAVKEHFGIPEGVQIGATIPVGHPAGRYGPVNRKPDREVTFWNRWGATR
jgi:nitroreductase